MNNVELIVEIPENQKTPEVDELPRFIHGILEKLAISNWQMGLVIADDKGIRRYNREWRGRDSATDVLSFVQGDGVAVPEVPDMPYEAGDVVVSLETIERNALEWSTPYEEELKRAVVHGILHLRGMDHPGDDYTRGMLKLQEELLGLTGSAVNSTQNGHD